MVSDKKVVRHILPIGRNELVLEENAVLEMFRKANGAVETSCLVVLRSCFLLLPRITGWPTRFPLFSSLPPFLLLSRSYFR